MKCHLPDLSSLRKLNDENGVGEFGEFSWSCPIKKHDFCRLVAF